MPRGCTTCHVRQGEDQKEYEGVKVPFLGIKKGDKYFNKSITFHSRCNDLCHRPVRKETGKKITGCSTCHTKEK